jgi:hypothetical protein
MADDPIPDDVKRFITDNIDSVAEMEGLLLLSKDPDAEWDARTLAQRLYTSDEESERVLAHLKELSIVVATDDKSPVYRYRPGSAEAGALVDRVTETYSKYLVRVTNLIHSKPHPKIQQFADAFRLRDEEKK